MTNEEKIAFIKLRIGDVPSNPLYPMFTEQDYELVLLAVGGNVDMAVRTMAISAVFLVGQINSREEIDDFIIENQFAENYLKALQYLINDPIAMIPSGLMPWVATKDCDRVQLLDVADLSCKGSLPDRCGC